MRTWHETGGHTYSEMHFMALISRSTKQNDQPLEFHILILKQKKGQIALPSPCQGVELCPVKLLSEVWKEPCVPHLRALPHAKKEAPSL